MVPCNFINYRKPSDNLYLGLRITLNFQKLWSNPHTFNYWTYNDRLLSSPQWNES